MTTLKVSDLSIHPKNEFYFDDMSGEKWEQFLKSVKTNGVRTPIIVTDDMRVVSGNQRVRACRELGISVINAEIEHYSNEDDVLRDLIEINIRQRGAIDDSEIKQARRIEFLQRYYGIKQGNNQHTKEDTTNGRKLQTKTQAELASELGVDVKTLQRAKKLAELPEEIQQMVMDGKVTASTASRAIAGMSPEEQKKFYDEFSGKDKVSSRDVEFYKKRIQTLSEENTELRNRQPEVRVVEKEIEVTPDDYEDLKRIASRIDSYKKDFDYARNRYEEMAEKWKKSEREKQSILDEIHRPENEKAETIKRSALFFCAGVANFIEKYGGYVWLATELGNMEKPEREGYIKAIDTVYAWASQMKENIGGRNE